MAESEDKLGVSNQPNLSVLMGLAISIICSQYKKKKIVCPRRHTVALNLVKQYMNTVMRMI